jgi:hypothetical protein
MARIRKLTPGVLKRIIAEEKQKISKQKSVTKRKRVNENAVDSLTRLTLQEIKVLLEAKRIRRKRAALKKSIAKRMK